MRWEINVFWLHTCECGHKNFLITGKVPKVLSGRPETPSEIFKGCLSGMGPVDFLLGHRL